METLSRVGKSRVFQTFLLISGIYWLLLIFIDLKSLQQILDGIVLVVALLAVGIYLPQASEELTKDRTTRSGRLLISVALIWAAMAGLRLLSIYGRGFNQLDDISESPIFGFILWIVMWAAILVVSAPSGDDPVETPYRYRTWIVAAIALGAGIGGFFIGLQFHNV